MLHEVKTYLSLTSGATLGPLTVQFEYDPGEIETGMFANHTIHRIEILGVPISNGLLKAITADGIAWTAINDLVEDFIDDAEISRQADHADHVYESLKDQGYESMKSLGMLS